jgi:hypothetical protein
MAKVTGGNKLEVILAKIGNATQGASFVRVGFLESATYPDGKKVAMIAAIQEFGAPRARIPPRPFFRNMIAKKSPEWGPAVAKLLKANDYNVRETLRMTGEAIAGQLRQSIIETMSPSLSPVTLMLRKMKAQNPGLRVTRKTVGEAARRVKAGESFGGVSTKPLVETGHLLNSVDYEVR